MKWENTLKKKQTIQKKKSQVFMDGFPAREERENQKAGLIVTLAELIKKLAKKPASHVAEKRGKREQSTPLVAQHRQHAAQKVKEKNGVKRNENYKITT